MIDGLIFHHLGVACQDLDAETKAFAALDYEVEGLDFVDADQGIRGRFLVGPGPRLELVTATPGSTVLEPWLERGVKFYHQAFLTRSVESSIEQLLRRRAKRLTPLARAVAFGGRTITFLMLPNLTLVELIQSEAIPGDRDNQISTPEDSGSTSSVARALREGGTT